MISKSFFDMFPLVCFCNGCATNRVDFDLGTWEMPAELGVLHGQYPSCVSCGGMANYILVDGNRHIYKAAPLYIHKHIYIDVAIF